MHVVSCFSSLFSMSVVSRNRWIFQGVLPEDGLLHGELLREESQNYQDELDEHSVH